MNSPKITRPTFPPGYVDKPASFLTWDWVATRLTESKHYWLCSVRPNGHPHVIPRWGVFLENKFYYDGSPETRHARNLRKNPHVTLNLENGSQAVFLEGIAKLAGKPSSELGKKLSQDYKKKYKEFGYAPEPNSWDEGGLFVFIPHQCIAWSNFTVDPTKFLFEAE
jgi:pyridoxamine 5'-phosphate oxidase-like protein